MASPQMGARRPTIRDLGSAATTTTTTTPQEPRPSPAPWFLEDGEGDDAAAASSGHHFLDECRMCGRHLARNRDVYMYKGDTPFCSEDCRDEQIRIDEHQERASRRRAAKVAATAASEEKSSAAQVKARTAAVAVGAV